MMKTLYHKRKRTLSQSVSHSASKIVLEPASHERLVLQLVLIHLLFSSLSLSLNIVYTTMVSYIKSST